MTLYKAIISGVIQGLTEFLPISSSGHLVLLHTLFGLKESQIAFDLYLHLGTLLAVIIFFFKEIIKLFNENKKDIILFIAAMIPTVIIALIFQFKIESFFARPKLTSIMLIITGLWLISGSLMQNRVNNKKEHMTVKQALLIGLAQGVSLIPGISRSGSTISTGLLCGLKQDKVVTFSFLLSVLAVSSAIVFAIIFKSDYLTLTAKDISLGILISGAASSFIFGMLAIKLVIKTIKHKKLHYFGYYCIILGGLGLTF